MMLVAALAVGRGRGIFGGGGFSNDGDFGGLWVQRFRGWPVQQFYKKLKKNKRKEKLTKKPNHPSYLLEGMVRYF